MITVRWLNGDPEEDIISAAAATAGKAFMARCDIERMIRAEHSPIHEAVLRIEDDACRSDVVSHLVRHTKGHPRHYVQSFRPDLTGKPRPTDPAAPRWYASSWPVDALLAMARQRLCSRAAGPTGAWVSDIRDQLLDQGGLMGIVARHMVPACEYRGGCPEGRACCGRMLRLDCLLDHRAALRSDTAGLYQRGTE